MNMHGNRFYWIDDKIFEIKDQWVPEFRDVSKDTRNRPFATSKSRGTKFAMLEGKLIIIPALGH